MKKKNVQHDYINSLIENDKKRKFEINLLSSEVAKKEGNTKDIFVEHRLWIE